MSADVRYPPPQPDRIGGPSTTALAGSLLGVGESVEGPAIVELRHTSVAVAPGQRLHAGGDGTLTLQL